MLHVFLRPAPQAVEAVLLTKLNGNHHTVGHALRAGVVVLDITNVTHGVSHLEIHFVGTTEHIVEHLMQLLFHLIGPVTHLHEKVTILTGLECTLFQRSLKTSGLLGTGH